MGRFKDLAIRDLKNQEIARLQRELESASQRLDELEERSRLRACKRADPSFTQDILAPDQAELRFAACVASGMTKLRVG